MHSLTGGCQGGADGRVLWGAQNQEALVALFRGHHHRQPLFAHLRASSSSFEGPSFRALSRRVDPSFQALSIDASFQALFRGHHHRQPLFAHLPQSKFRHHHKLLLLLVLILFSSLEMSHTKVCEP
jgi:hypothetical protein